MRVRWSAHSSRERGIVTQAEPHGFNSLGPTTQFIQHSLLWSLRLSISSKVVLISAALASDIQLSIFQLNSKHKESISAFTIITL